MLLEHEFPSGVEFFGTWSEEVVNRHFIRRQESLRKTAASRWCGVKNGQARRGRHPRLSAVLAHD